MQPRSSAQLSLAHLVDHSLSLSLCAKDDVDPTSFVRQDEALLLMVIMRRTTSGDIVDMFRHDGRLA